MPPGKCWWRSGSRGSPFNMCGDVATPNLYVVAPQNCLQAPDTKTTVMGRRSGSSSSNDDVERAGLKALGTHVLYLFSDRAKALIQLAEQGLECLSMPDFFHVVHDIIKSYSLAMGRHLRHAHQDLMKAQEALARCRGVSPAAYDAIEAQAFVEARQAEVQQWEEVQRTYRHHLETLSLTLH